MEVRPYRDEDYRAFVDLVVAYFRDDLKLDWSEGQMRRVALLMTTYSEAGQHWIDVLEDPEDPGVLCGFLEYQVDHVGLNWNYRPGDGFIRECYVRPELRRQGYGRQLLAKAEQLLLQDHVSAIYLTCDDACHIWERLGYRDAGVICSLNGGQIYEKHAIEEPVR